MATNEEETKLKKGLSAMFKAEAGDRDREEMRVDYDPRTGKRHISTRTVRPAADHGGGVGQPMPTPEEDARRERMEAAIIAEQAERDRKQKRVELKEQHDAGELSDSAYAKEMKATEKKTSRHQEALAKNGGKHAAKTKEEIAAEEIVKARVKAVQELLAEGKISKHDFKDSVKEIHRQAKEDQEAVAHQDKNKGNNRMATRPTQPGGPGGRA